MNKGKLRLFVASALVSVMIFVATMRFGESLSHKVIGYVGKIVFERLYSQFLSVLQLSALFALVPLFALLLVKKDQAIWKNFLINVAILYGCEMLIGTFRLLFIKLLMSEPTGAGVKKYDAVISYGVLKIEMYLLVGLAIGVGVILLKDRLKQKPLS